MTTNTDYSPLLEGVLTKEDLESFIDQLDQLDHDMFEVKIGFEQAVNNLSYSKKEKFLALLHSLHIEPNQPVKIQDQIRSVQEYLKSIPVLTLTLSFDPTQEQLRKIILSVTDQTEAPIVIHVERDNSIIGGARIEWKGKIVDQTVEKKIEEYFSGHPN